MSDSIKKILVADAISDAGVELLAGTSGFHVDVRTGMKPDELKSVLGGYDGLIVRSATKVTADVLEHSGKLRAIGRAGTGVDNIDLKAATAGGIVVMNTPGGNSVAAAELTMSLLLALARNVPQANSDLRDGRWERKKYMGTEVAGKTLGIAGLGRIGREVARMAQGFRMKTVGFDPFVSTDAAQQFGVERIELDELVDRSDFITLHLPRNEETKHLFDAARLGRMRSGACIVNCARGGLIDESALLAALDAGKIAGAAIDVFETEPPTDLRLVEHPRVVSTPHLGASTREAQVRVGTEIAEKLRDYLQNGIILDAVNFPSINRTEFATLGPLMDLAERLGSLAGQLTDGALQSFEVRLLGSYAESSAQPVEMAAVKGLLSSHVAGAVSYVNSLELARSRGLQVERAAGGNASPYSGLVRLALKSESGDVHVGGTLFHGEPRVVEINGVSIESRADGNLMLIKNRDVPGVLGRVGKLLGDSGINIAGIQLGRIEGSDRAISIVAVDGPVPAETLESIRQVDEITTARLAVLDD